MIALDAVDVALEERRQRRNQAAGNGPSGDPADATPLISASRPMMGGIVSVHLGIEAGAGPGDSTRRAADRVLARLEAWADRLTRFSATSDLAELNAASAERVPVRPTLAALLDWGRVAQTLSSGIVDIAMLDARLAAEWPDLAPDLPADSSPASRRWSIERGSRRSHVVRPAGLTFDLDGIAKGWLADRALRRLAGYPTAVVDADGDLAIRVGGHGQLTFGVADPRERGRHIATLALNGPGAGGMRVFGLATSGTSIHRWKSDGLVSHHLIDPRTGRPARTDVVQATVLGNSARAAEAIAKTAVILRSEAALERLDRADVKAAVLLTEGDEILATPGIEEWLA